MVGGLYRLEGAWVGALLYTVIDNYSRDYTPTIGNVLGPERFNTLIGIVFLVIILVSPGGIVGLWEQGRRSPPRGRRRWNGPEHGRTGGNGGRPRSRHSQVRIREEWSL